MTCDLTRDSEGGGTPQKGRIPEEDMAGNCCGLLGPVACFAGREQPLRVNGRGDSRAEDTRGHRDRVSWSGPSGTKVTAGSFCWAMSSNIELELATGSRLMSPSLGSAVSSDGP